MSYTDVLPSAAAAAISGERSQNYIRLFPHMAYEEKDTWHSMRRCYEPTRQWAELEPLPHCWPLHTRAWWLANASGEICMEGNQWMTCCAIAIRMCKRGASAGFLGCLIGVPDELIKRR